MNRVDTHHIPDLFNPTAGLTHDRAGSLAGEQVRVKDAASVLDDAKEEIGMHHSEKVEAKDFSERMFEGSQHVQYMRVEQIEKYLDSTQRFRDPRGLAEITKRLQASARPRIGVQRESRSVAHQFALLQFALADARAISLPIEVIERLEEALEELDHQAGPEIRAGLNSAQAAAGFEPTAQGVENFQQAYSDIVLGETTFAQTLLVVLQRLSGARGEDFQRGLQALLQALGADLSATRASTAPQRLQALVQDVYQLELAGSVLEDCRELSGSIAGRFGVESVIPLELMKELVGLTGERWVTPARLGGIAEKFGLSSLLQRIAFHSGTKSVLRKMPVKVFRDEDARQGVLNSAQAVLDEAIAEEEERQGA